MNRFAFISSYVLSGCLLVTPAIAQEQQSQASSETKTETKAPVATEQKRPLSANARLMGAKTAYVKKGSGNGLAYNVVSTTMEGWGRFQLVNDPGKADITVEVIAPDENGGITVSSSTTTSPMTGRPEQTSSANRQVGQGGPVRLNVYDTKTHMLLFMDRENAKYAIKVKTREDNIVEAAQKLVGKFRDRVEAAAPAQ